MRDEDAVPTHPLLGVHWAVLLGAYLLFLTVCAALLAWGLGHSTLVTVLYHPSVSWAMAMVVCLSCWTLQVALTDPGKTVLPQSSKASPTRTEIFQHVFVAWLLVFLFLMGPVIYLLGLDWGERKDRAHSLVAFFSTLFLLCLPVLPGPQGLISPLVAGLAWATGLTQ